MEKDRRKMEKFKAYLLGNFEQFFILIILVTVFLINYYIPQKMAFLNFYFLPIIMAGYYLGLRFTVLGAFLCIILVATYTTLYPHLFILPSTRTDLYLHIAAWGGFLILAGVVVGNQHLWEAGRKRDGSGTFYSPYVNAFCKFIYNK